MASLIFPSAMEIICHNAHEIKKPVNTEIPPVDSSAQYDSQKNSPFPQKSRSGPRSWFWGENAALPKH